jgi:hypothetical protein
MRHDDDEKPSFLDLFIFYLLNFRHQYLFIVKQET